MSNCSWTSPWQPHGLLTGWLPLLSLDRFWSHHLCCLWQPLAYHFCRAYPTRARLVSTRQATVMLLKVQALCWCAGPLGLTVTHAIRFLPDPPVFCTELSSPVRLFQLWLDPGLWCLAARRGQGRALCWRSSWKSMTVCLASASPVSLQGILLFIVCIFKPVSHQFFLCDVMHF